MATAAAQAPALPWNTNVPSQYTTELQTLSAAGKLNGIAPQILTYIMEAESGPSYKGGGWNGVAGGWFGLETPDGLSQAQITDPSIASFDTQAEVASSIYAKLLTGNGNNPIAAENEYQTGHPSVAANGAGIFEHFGLQNDADSYTAGAADAGGTDPANPVPGPAGDALGLATGGSSLPGSEAAANGLSGTWENVVSDIFGGFGIGWKAVLTIIGGILLIGVGLLVMFRHQAGDAASVAALA
jgi:hypothetical protein